MADQTTSSIVIPASAATIMGVIADFEAYPAWAKGVTKTEILSTAADGRAEQVAFDLDVAPISDSYTLQYQWDGDRQVTWSLVEGKVLTMVDGAYILRPLGDEETEVTYRLALDVKIPLIGMLKRKGERILIDTALKGLRDRVAAL